MADAEPARASSRAATAMPVIEGALAFIVIGFIASAWESIPEAHHNDAFVVVFASGAHFIFSFLFAAPAMAAAPRIQGGFSSFSLMLGLYAYVFWSLIVQHCALAELFLAGQWRIPIPFADVVANAFNTALGGPEMALYFGPLVLAYLVTVVAFAVLWLPSLAAPRRKVAVT
jgi:hypothetical protein